MKSILLILVTLILISCSEKENTKVLIQSPDKKIQVFFNVIDTEAFYHVKFDSIQVINRSRLGFEFENLPALKSNFKIAGLSKTSVNNSWQQVWGEKKIVVNNYNQAIIQLEEIDGLKRKLNITFKVFNDGLGFSYEIPKQKAIDSIYISNEITEFELSHDYSTWFIPANFDSYEALYQNKPASEIMSANTPITFESAKKDFYLSIHEANLTDYAGMTLKKQDTLKLNLQVDLVPWPNGVKVKAKAPMKTPWRTIQISNSAEKLIESSLILNLNEANKLKDVSWIKPTKYVGIWWGMHIGTHTWIQGKRHGATTDNMKEYIDFAAANNIKSVLAEGWNTGWEKWGQPKAFDFITPYDDFDLQEIADYANKKGVKLIGHHETGGDTKYYEKQMEKAFGLYKSLGIHMVKTGYAGAITPSGQYHHGQYMVNHYRKVVELAAKYKLVVDAHEPIKATGIRRTYPNMMTREGARGMEWNGWSDGNPPEHHVILPFTRILAGPMDYTPGVFDLLYENSPKRVVWNSNDKGTSRINTTLSKQLALFVVFYSPMQMASDLVKNYKSQPAFQFISDVPVNWEYTKVLNAKIGDFVTIARKDWDSDDWFLGAVTDENGRTLDVKLNFLDEGETYEAQIYKDAENSDWKTNPYAHQILKQKVTNKDNLSLKLAPGGGQAIRFKVVL
ncbi:MAG: alpha-glucosidase [Bacteroidetes bacterium 4572_117]|nr:MAG: alpha-glucosidase [Bacteroidetes bacterium 4572_117]